MDRKKRVQVVVVAAIGLAALFVAYIGAPLIGVFLWPTPNLSGDAGEFMESFSHAARTAQIVNTISIASLGVAGVCTIYLLVMLAAWFIGPPECETNQKV